MPCYSPLTGWKSKHPNPTGKYSITFIKSEGYTDKEITLPCGQCHGCRLEHSRQWAIRCMHEAQMHKNNCFLTLTYSDEKLPKIGTGESTLKKRHFQLFMMRLRKKYGKGIKFYACGEYGDSSGRAHYHACIFGMDFKDKTHWSTRDDIKLYVSEELNKLWTDPEDKKPYGFATIGEVTFQSAAYVARYCMKKRKGKNWQQFYERYTDLETGEVISLEPEFPLMSRRPGIGKSWLDKYGKEVRDNDSVICNKKEMKPPKYYDYILEKNIPTKYEEIKAQRLAAAKKAIHNNSLARLHTRGIVKKSQIQQLKKEL